jgi:hypothetical protein
MNRTYSKSEQLVALSGLLIGILLLASCAHTKREPLIVTKEVMVPVYTLPEVPDLPEEAELESKQLTEEQVEEQPTLLFEAMARDLVRLLKENRILRARWEAIFNREDDETWGDAE